MAIIIRKRASANLKLDPIVDRYSTANQPAAANDRGASLRLAASNDSATLSNFIDRIAKRLADHDHQEALRENIQ